MPSASGLEHLNDAWTQQSVAQLAKGLVPADMEAVLTWCWCRDAILHVCRIHRVLMQPRGNALLVGVGGSGRKSLSRLATYVAEQKCFSIEISKGYRITEFREDLKSLYRQVIDYVKCLANTSMHALINIAASTLLLSLHAGVSKHPSDMQAGCQNKPTVFLFDETQIVQETFLEDINNILTSGAHPITAMSISKAEMRLCHRSDRSWTPSSPLLVLFFDILSG